MTTWNRGIPFPAQNLLKRKYEHTLEWSCGNNADKWEYLFIGMYLLETSQLLENARITSKL